jgi:hypothetical protein
MSHAEDVHRSRIVAVRLPPKLRAALEKARDQQFTSISDVARAAIAQAMRANGLLDEV